MEREIRYEVALLEGGEFIDSFRCTESTLAEVKQRLIKDLNETDNRRELLLGCHHFTVEKVEKYQAIPRTPWDTAVFITCGVVAGMVLITSALIFGIGVTTLAGWLWN